MSEETKFFVCQFTDDEAELCDECDLDEEGTPIKNSFWVPISRVQADQDGVFVKLVKIDGEDYYNKI